MTKTRWGRLLTFAVACSFGGGNAAAQVNEADRLQRCQNNRAALAAAQNELLVSGYMTDEQLERARTAYTSIRRERANEVQAATDFTVSGRTDQRALERYRRAVNSQREAAAAVNVFCLSTSDEAANDNCLLGLPNAVEGMIDLAVRVRESSQPAVQRLAGFQSNLIALRCDQAANPSYGLGGLWIGTNSLVYEVSQTGTSFGWQVASINETASGTFDGTTVTATWNGNNGPGSATGTVSFGADGVPNRISWTNGNVFTRR